MEQPLRIIIPHRHHHRRRHHHELTSVFDGGDVRNLPNTVTFILQLRVGDLLKSTRHLYKPASLGCIFLILKAGGFES